MGQNPSRDRGASGGDPESGQSSRRESAAAPSFGAEKTPLPHILALANGGRSGRQRQSLPSPSDNPISPRKSSEGSPVKVVGGEAERVKKVNAMATVQRRGSVSESGARAAGGNNDEEFQSIEKRKTERRKSLDLGLRDVLKEVAHAVASPHLPKRLRRPSNDMTSALMAAAANATASSTAAAASAGGSGRRSRRGSVDQGPWMQVREAPPEIPLEEVYDPSSIDRSAPRGRATTIGNGHALRLNTGNVTVAALAARAKKKQGEAGNKKLIPTVFRFTGTTISKGSKDAKVYLAGSMTNWRAVEMSRQAGESDFLVIIDCDEGEIHYKFYAEGAWKHDHKQACVRAPPSDSDGDMPPRAWNVIHVKRSDENVFEALACDSFSLKSDRSASANANDEDRLQADSWTQEKPTDHVLSSMSKGIKGPPILPPHLLNVLLNKEERPSMDPVILHEPSHVSLHHLYAQSIRENMLVLSSTTRYRKKCVTTILYKPLEVAK